MKRVTRDQLCTSFSATHPPVLRVQPGEPFVMETNDRFATYEGPTSSPEALGILQTMAGPVYIEGATPGATLKPVVTTATEVLTTGEGATMEAATTMAVQGMADLLVETLGVDDTEAAMLIACAADVRTGLVGHPPYTIRVAIPKSLLAW